MEYPIYVPRQDTPLYNLHPKGTAFVGADRNDYICLYYEEPADYANVKTFEDRVNHAAGRLDERYPTSKITSSKPEDLILVGYATRTEKVGWYISQIVNEDELYKWDEGPHWPGGSPDFQQRALMKLVLKD